MRQSVIKREADIRSDFDAIVGTAEIVVVRKYDKGAWGWCRINGVERPYQRLNAFVRRGLLILIERRGEGGKDWIFRNVA